MGVGKWRDGQIHKLEKDAPSVQNERRKEVHPGVEEVKVADKGLHDWQRSSLHVFCQDLSPTAAVSQGVVQRSQGMKD